MTKRKDRTRSQLVPRQDILSGPCVIVVAGADDSPEQKVLRQELVTAAGRAGLTILKTVRIETHRVVGGEEKDRLFPLLVPEDARWMYSELHRYDIAVLALRASYVRQNPSVAPARRRQLLPLGRFVRYKAYYGVIRNNQDVGFHITQFVASLNAVNCDGLDDPRILPLHIFDSDKEWRDLDGLAERLLFVREHGPPGRRHDSSGFSWTKPRGQAAKHGGPALRVARHTLEQGFHWDVSTDSSGTICTANAVWKLRRPDSYLNIYPDGFIRPPSPRYGAVQVWP